MKIFTHLFRRDTSATLKRIKEELTGFFHFKWKLIPYSANEGSGIGEDFIYCPHPFTNWSLNPGYRNSIGEIIHTIEGFRKTEDYESLQQYFGDNINKSKIYCFGGSTTYCTEVPALMSPWPSLLSKKIKNLDPRTNCVVANAGVGGWSTFPSLIRLIAWGPILKPDLIIVYLSKNDLTHFYNANLNEKSAFPDYSNFMGQFAQGISSHGIFGSRVCRQSNGGVGCVYGDMSHIPSEGLMRYNEPMLFSTIFRYDMICATARIIQARVLFIPEIIWGSPYQPYMKKIHAKMKELTDKYDHCSFFDVQNMLPNNKKYFQDKMHFTEEGCSLFSDILSRHIVVNELL
jgi:hypothetical protein